MEITDLTDEEAPLYFVCLEDWSEEMKEAGDHKAVWYAKMRNRGLRVKLARDDRGEVGGMIQYLPIEHAPAEGRGLYFILCIWVHGYKQGRGDFRKQGMGKALLQAAEADARALGAAGMAAWGLWLPVWMRASWFRKHGYSPADRMGMQVLLWKPFTPEAQPPRWIREKKRPEAVPGQVTVTAFRNGWCPAQSITCERARRAAGSLGEQVVFQEADTSEREMFLEWGISDALFLDDRPMAYGPPPSCDRIHKAISKRLRRLR